MDEAVQDVGSSELFGADVFDDAGIVSDLEALGPLSTIDQALIIAPRVVVVFERSNDRVSLFCRELDESSVEDRFGQIPESLHNVSREILEHEPLRSRREVAVGIGADDAIWIESLVIGG